MSCIAIKRNGIVCNNTIHKNYGSYCAVHKSEYYSTLLTQVDDKIKHHIAPLKNNINTLNNNISIITDLQENFIVQQDKHETNLNMINKFIDMLCNNTIQRKKHSIMIEEIQDEADNKSVFKITDTNKIKNIKRQNIKLITYNGTQSRVKNYLNKNRKLRHDMINKIRNNIKIL